MTNVHILLIICRVSAAKAPFLARFKVCRCGIDALEKIGMMDDNEIDRLTASSSGCVGPGGGGNTAAGRRSSVITLTTAAQSSSSHKDNIAHEYWQAAIFKVGDDVRQVSGIQFF